MPELEKEIKEQVCARRKRGRGALIRQNDVRGGLQKGQAGCRALKRLGKLLYGFTTTLRKQEWEFLKSRTDLEHVTCMMGQRERH